MSESPTDPSVLVAKETLELVFFLPSLSKDKVFGGMPFECFTPCYGATVQSMID